MPSSFSSSSAMRSRDKAIRSLARCGAGVDGGGVGFARAEARVETEEAQDAQMVFGDALKGIADEADVPLLEIVEPAEIIEDFAGRRVGEQGVDREVAAGGIGLPVVGERHRRPAAVGLDVGPQGRDLERMAVADRGDRAMLDARSARP